MATLADAGQKKTNENNPFPYATPATTENNPYQQALQGGYADDIFAGTTNAAGKAPVQPKLGATSDPNAAQPVDPNAAAPSGPGLVGTGLLKALGPTPTTVSDSVANTPEAMSASETKSEKQTADLAQINHAISPSTAKGPKAPTSQQNINAALAPDQAILDSLPAEYQSTMAQLAPYLSSGQDTGNAALNAADANVSAAVGEGNDKVLAALTSNAKGSKQYAKSVSTEPIVQALLGFQKYEDTSAGATPPGQSSWSQSMDDIYQYLTGTAASGNSSGLGTPQAAASAAAASTAASVQDSESGGGNG